MERSWDVLQTGWKLEPVFHFAVLLTLSVPSMYQIPPHPWPSPPQHQCPPKLTGLTTFTSHGG